MFSGGEYHRQDLTDKQLSHLNLKKKAFVDGEQIPIGLDIFTDRTGKNVEHTGFSDLNIEDNVYTAKKEISNYISELFMKLMLNESEILFLFMIANICYHEVMGKDSGNENMLIKGGVVLSIFREKMFKYATEKYKEMNDTQKDVCKDYVDLFKPKIADLDLICPVPDSWKSEERLAVGFKIYRCFGSYFKTDGLITKISKEFCERPEILNFLKVRDDGDEERDTIRKHILDAMGVQDEQLLKTAEFNMEPAPSYSTYTRHLEGFNTESYRIDPEGPEMILTCGCVEGITLVTSKQKPILFDLSKIVMNFKITLEGSAACKQNAITVKVGLIDIPFQNASTIESKHSVDIPLVFKREELNTIKSHLYKEKQMKNEVHMITVDYAVNHDIRDMLYKRNFFVFEDTKYEKRLRRDILYNALLIFKKTDINRARTELKDLQDKLSFILECAEKHITADKEWLKCIEKESGRTKLNSGLYKHIITSIHDMTEILLKDDKKRPTYINVNKYTDKLRVYLDTLVFEVAFIYKLFGECGDMLRGACL